MEEKYQVPDPGSSLSNPKQELSLFLSPALICYREPGMLLLGLFF